MGYLNELLSKNPLVIDGDTIRPHHKYTDDLYTGGNHKITNYDRIKSMSVEEMARWIVGLKLVFECHALGGDAHEVLPKLNNSEKQELDEWLEEGKATYKQWLLQEVSENE